MPQYRIACGACGKEFDVLAVEETKRCPSCGVEHSEPWTDPEIVSVELAEALGHGVRKPRVIMEPADPRGGRV